MMNNNKCMWSATGQLVCHETFRQPNQYSINVLILTNDESKIIKTYQFPVVFDTQTPLIHIMPGEFKDMFETVTIRIQDLTPYSTQPPLSLYIYTSDIKHPIQVKFNNTISLTNLNARTLSIPNVSYANINIKFVNV